MARSLATDLTIGPRGLPRAAARHPLRFGGDAHRVQYSAHRRYSNRAAVEPDSRVWWHTLFSILTRGRQHTDRTSTCLPAAGQRGDTPSDPYPMAAVPGGCPGGVGDGRGQDFLAGFRSRSRKPLGRSVVAYSEPSFGLPRACKYSARNLASRAAVAGSTVVVLVVATAIWLGLAG